MQCALAVSLHAPNDELRNELVPSIENIRLPNCSPPAGTTIDQQNGRSITFEYVMLTA